MSGHTTAMVRSTEKRVHRHSYIHIKNRHSYKGVRGQLTPSSCPFIYILTRHAHTHQHVQAYSNNNDDSKKVVADEDDGDVKN